MRIAQVAPLSESVPPKLYGGTERVVSYLTEELVRRGEEVSLFASADSETSADLIPACPAALRLDGRPHVPEARHLAMLEQVFDLSDRFDIIHFHVDWLHFPLLRRHPLPHVTTLHGRLDLPDLEALFQTYPGLPMISISDAQRRPLPWLNWLKTIPHGLPPDVLDFNEHPADYVAFVGRISPEKRVDRAIEIARRSGVRLKIAAKIEPAERPYFEEVVQPLIDGSDAEYIGEIGEREKSEFVGNARAVLFPIDWPEPFGLVMIESFACGTPVIAWPCGSVPEVMRDGVSGFVVDSIEQGADAVGRIDRLSRQRVRRYFEERFSVAGMADAHLEVYRDIAGRAGPHASRKSRIGTSA